MKEELRKKEQLKEVAARKQEKLDDAKARAKVKADIAATQAARREASARAKAEREGKVVEQEPAATTSQSSASSAAASSSSAPRPTAAHTEARLRLQFAPGAGRQPLTKSFPASTTLFEVAAAVTQETGVEVKTLTTTFPPRKTFKIEEPIDMGLSLKEANLTPSASLIVG